MSKISSRSLRLERLCADRSEEDSIELERCLGGSRDGQMTEMRRVEAASEKGDAEDE